MSDLVIATSGLRKSFGPKLAVADLTLQVPKGEVFGFLGPNGAGKSMAIKMLLGLVRPSGGEARVLGQPPGHTATLARVGFLPEHFRFQEWLQGAELLDLHARLYGMDATTRRRRVAELLDLVGLTEAARRPLSDFSKGMLQRIGLAQALLNEPDLVFLDEPTSALDPFGRRLVRGIIRDLKERSTTVFLNSHLLSEVELTCDRVSFIKAGRVLRTVALGDLAAGHVQVELRVDAVTPALLAALSGLALETRLAGDGREAGTQPSAELSAERAEVAQAVAPSAVRLRPASPTTIELAVRDEEVLPAVAERVLASGVRLYALTPHKVSLEQLFLDIVGDEDSGQ